MQRARETSTRSGMERDRTPQEEHKLWPATATEKRPRSACHERCNFHSHACWSVLVFFNGTVIDGLQLQCATCYHYSLYIETTSNIISRPGSCLRWSLTNYPKLPLVTGLERQNQDLVHMHEHVRMLLRKLGLVVIYSRPAPSSSRASTMRSRVVSSWRQNQLLDHRQARLPFSATITGIQAFHAAKQNIAVDTSGVRERLLLVDLTLGAAEPSSLFILCSNNVHAYAHFCSPSYIYSIIIIIIILLTRQIVSIPATIVRNPRTRFETLSKVTTQRYQQKTVKFMRDKTLVDKSQILVDKLSTRV
jgi:hypothetical protein